MIDFADEQVAPCLFLDELGFITASLPLRGAEKLTPKTDTTFPSSCRLLVIFHHFSIDDSHDTNASISATCRPGLHIVTYGVK